MKKELLAPAGNFETLKQAIHNGCDAVYLAGKNYGARKYADNFTDLELIEAIKYCHLCGVKIYVTVNTVIFDNEVDECLKYLTFLHESGVDAVIMQDMGMITLTRKVLPNLDIHVSTQAHTHNIEQIKLLETLGVTRVVVAREVSIDEINKMDTNLEIEAFVHGALCVCYSGQCLFSSMLLNRSGNRGECAQVCRLPFTLVEEDKELNIPDKYLLSTKELNTTSKVKELFNSKITSFKIEGRMKNPTTIGFITRLYRYLIDHYEKNEEITLSEEENKKLLSLFNREYTTGYLFNNIDIMNIKSPNHIGIPIGKVMDVNTKKIKIKLSDKLYQGDGIRFMESNLGMIANFIYDEKDNLINSANSGDIVYLDNKVDLKDLDSINKTIDSKLILELENYDLKKIPIDIIASINDKTFNLSITDSINKVEVNGDIVEEVINSGTSIDRIKEQLLKLGNTPFICNKIDVSINDNVFIPIAKLNELRRDAIDKLISIRENTKKEVIVNEKEKINSINSNDPISISCLVRTKEQLDVCLEENIDTIYVDNYKLYLEYKDKPNIYLRINRVINKFNDLNNTNLLVGETGSINKYISNNKINTDYFLNVTNSYYVNYLRNIGINKICLSTENSFDSVKSIVSTCGNSNIEVIIYSRIEAMITKYCLLRKVINKDDICHVCSNNKKYYLKDRNGSLYPIINDNINHLMHIFYYTEFKFDNINGLKNIGIKNYRIDFLYEDCKETSNIIKKYKSLLLDR